MCLLFPPTLNLMHIAPQAIVSNTNLMMAPTWELCRKSQLPIVRYRIFAVSYRSNDVTCTVFLRQCSAECGRGMKQRRVTCMDHNSEDVPSVRCTATRPINEDICDMGSCARGWFYTAWPNNVSRFNHIQTGRIVTVTLLVVNILFRNSVDICVIIWRWTVMK